MQGTPYKSLKSTLTYHPRGVPGRQSQEKEDGNSRILRALILYLQEQKGANHVIILLHEGSQACVC